MNKKVLIKFNLLNGCLIMDNNVLNKISIKKLLVNLKNTK